ncbi:MAG: Grx4 family monothiol glutaredoxin [Mariprofundales bacterium]
MNSVNNTVQQRIADLVQNNNVVLFMKGTPQFPQCGFSNRVAEILQSNAVEFTHVNILLEPDIREGVKVFSNWPTLPQLYVHGEFIGGCDIIMELDNSGELATILAPKAVS